MTLPRFLLTTGFIAICFITGAGHTWAQDTTAVGSISGVVTRGDGTPAAGVVLCLQTGSRCVTTDGGGVFKISDVRAGEFALEVTAPGLPTYPAASVRVMAGLDAKVDVTLPTLDNVHQEVTVTAAAFAVPTEVKTSSFLIQPSEILKSASALQDVSRYLHTLPGVAIGSDDFRNDIIVRGGSPLENLFVVDNVEVPNINTFASFASAGGTVSILDAELIQSATFLTGGYPAPYGNHTSSVLQMTEREGSRQGFWRARHRQLCRRGRHPGGAHQSGQRLVDRVGPAQLSGRVHTGRGVRRGAGALHPQRQARLRRDAA